MTQNTEKSFSLKHKRALFLHQHDHIDQAIESYLQLLDQHPEQSDELHHLLAIAYGQKKSSKQALEHIKYVLKSTPKNASIHRAAGNIYEQLNDTKKAFSHFKKASELDDSVSSWFLMGQHAMRHHAPNARTYYMHALRADPEHIETLFQLSLLDEADKNLEEAQKKLTTICTLNPQYESAWLRYAQHAYHQNQLDEAHNALKKLIALNPQHAIAYHVTGCCYTASNEIKKAIEAFEKTLSIDPNHIETLHNLGAIYCIQKEPQKALNYWSQILAHAPSQEAYYNCAVIYMYAGRLNDAKIYFEHALKHDPNHTGTHINMAHIFLKEDNTSKAIASYEHALSLDPNQPDVRYLLDALCARQNHHRAPPSYVQNLFDQYAAHYEKHLLEHLDYHTHKLLGDLCLEHIKPCTYAIDLGCGTGLNGPWLKKIAQSICGIDLSQNMLDQAYQKHCYTSLRCGDIIQDLETADLYVASDVLCYLGDLAPLLENITKYIAPHGWFAFNVESGNTPKPHLTEHGRFAHSIEYLHILAKTYGFSIISEARQATRTQDNAPYHSWLCLWQKSK